MNLLDGKIYLVIPGNVVSKTDGQEHWLNGRALIGLYQVDPKDCVVVGEYSRLKSYPTLIPLFPKFDGNYTVPFDSFSQGDPNE